MAVGFYQRPRPDLGDQTKGQRKVSKRLFGVGLGPAGGPPACEDVIVAAFPDPLGGYEKRST